MSTQIKRNIFYYLKILLIIISLVGAFYTIDELYGFGKFAYGQTETEFSNFLNFSLKIFQNIIFFFLLLNIFFSFKIWHIGLISPIAYLEQNHNWFYNVHYFLLKNNLYSYFSDQPYNISPEYPRVWFFIITCIIFFILLFIKKFRNISRIFLFLASVSSLCTAILFHTVIVSEINFYKQSQEQLYKRSNSILTTQESISIFCKTNKFSCLSYSADNYNSFFEDNRIPQYIKVYFPMVKSGLNKNQNQYLFYSTATDFSAPNRILGQKPFAIMKNENLITLSIDDYQYKLLLARNQTLFAILGFASHTTWFFGALFLIWFHKKRISRKNRLFN